MNLDALDDLLDAYLLGQASPEETAQLQQALRTDSAARARFVQAVFIETGLHHLARSDPASLLPAKQALPGTGPRRPHAAGRFRSPRVLAIAAMILVAVGGLAVFYSWRHDSRNVARVTSGAVLVDGQSSDRIPDGSTLVVAGPGSAEIRLSDGSVATLDAGTRLTLRGQVDATRQVLTLDAGGGHFHVTHGGGQFRLDTAVGSVTVLGTEFTAALRPPNSLFVEVRAGTVQFDDDGKTVTLIAGQSGTFGREPDRPLPRAEAEPLVEKGTIRSVDFKAQSFVLAGPNESVRTFHLGGRSDKKETDVLLDGKRTNFESAIQPGRRVTVICVREGGDLWISKLEASSAKK